MPSFLPKKRTENPYMNPHHPSHTPPLPLPKKASSPSLLQQARVAASRDPHTGALSTHPSIAPFIASPSQSHQPPTSSPHTSSSADTSPPNPHAAAPLPTLYQVLSEERTAWQNRRLTQPARRTSGSRYEIVAAEAKRREEEEMRVRAARGGTEYYAPERRVVEFYSGVLED